MLLVASLHALGLKRQSPQVSTVNGCDLRTLQAYTRDSTSLLSAPVTNAAPRLQAARLHCREAVAAMYFIKAMKLC